MLTVWASQWLDGLWRHALGSGLRGIIYVIAHRNEQVEKPKDLCVSIVPVVLMSIE